MLVEDHLSFRQSLALLISREPDILRRGGLPAEVRHVPDNSGVGCLGVDNLALDALPTVPSSRPTGCRCTIALAGALVRVSGAGCLQT
jgi:hypothetical protein